MRGKLTRRQALARAGGAGVAAVGLETALAGLSAPAHAATATVRGAWIIEPKTASGPAGFRAVAAFAAGGVFITIGSDEPGTGIGEWKSPTADGFAFTYLNFHFDAEQKLNNTVKVRAAGTFSGDTLEGHATLEAHDAHGHPLFAPRHFSFTGKRLAVQAP